MTLKIVDCSAAGHVNNSDVEKLLNYLKENKPAIEAAMTLCIAAFAVIAKEQNLTWEMVVDNIESSFKKSVEAFEDIGILSGPKN